MLDRLRSAWGDTLDDERGDVPGWVLITLMTAGSGRRDLGARRTGARRAVRAGDQRVSGF